MGATEREQLEYRAPDHHIKNLGKGKMEILMTDPVQGRCTAGSMFGHPLTFGFRALSRLCSQGCAPPVTTVRARICGSRTRNWRLPFLCRGDEG
jgi:hypothetical protein